MYFMHLAISQTHTFSSLRVGWGECDLRLGAGMGSGTSGGGKGVERKVCVSVLGGGVNMYVC